MQPLVDTKSKPAAVLIFDAFFKVMETLRYHAFEEINVELFKLYAVFTDCRYYLTGLLDQHRRTTFTTIPHAEIEWFVGDRLVFLIHDMLKFIQIYINTVTNDIMTNSPDRDGAVRIGSHRFTNVLSLSDLNLIEYELSRIYEHFADFQQHDEGSPLLTRYDIPALKDIIRYLSNRLESQIICRHTLGQVSHVNELNRVAPNVNFSNQQLCIIGYLIMKCVVVYLRVNSDIFQVSCDTKRQMQYQLVGEDYARCLSYGTAPFQNVLCCYKNIKALPLAISNPSGGFNSVDKEFLLSILILSKML